MSRIGNLPISIPSDVTIDVSVNEIKVNGPKGTLVHSLNSRYVSSMIENGTLVLKRSGNDKKVRAYHGMIRSKVSNMIIGVTKGYKKQLEVNGVGFKIDINGNNLKLALGLSHDVNFVAPEGISMTHNKNENIITIEGIDKQLVGETTAQIRALKKPEPYKGKGIKYVGERIIRKAGKTAAGAGE